MKKEYCKKCGGHFHVPRIYTFETSKAVITDYFCPECGAFLLRKDVQLKVTQGKE